MADITIPELTAAVATSNNDLFETAVVDGQSTSGYASKKLSMAQIANHIAAIAQYPGLNTTEKELVDAINEIFGVALTGTLTAGNTTLTLQNAAITTNSTVDIYTDTYGVNPTDVTLSSGSITLTFAPQSANIAVKVIIK